MRIRRGSSADAHTSPASPAVLATARTGSTVQVTGVAAHCAEKLRLAEFGLRRGAVVTLVARTAGGGYLVAHGTSRIALDQRTASCLTTAVPTAAPTDAPTDAPTVAPTAVQPAT